MKNLKLLLILLVPVLASSFELISTKEKRNPVFGGYVSVGDLNNDGYKDIFTRGLYYISPAIPGCFYCQYEYDVKPKILINDQNGSFVENNLDFDFPIGAFQSNFDVSYHSVIADINSDGHNDVVSAEGVALINDGSANFSNPINLGILKSDKQIYVIDFDNDGVVEILSHGTIHKREAIEELHFIDSENLRFNTDDNFAFADFNNDDFIDIVSYSKNSMVKIYLNNNGVFVENNSIELEQLEPLNLVTGDIDFDGNEDLIFSNRVILLNNGKGQFIISENQILPREEQYRDFIVNKLVHFNEDEYPDLVVTVEVAYDSYGGTKYRYNQYVMINDKDGNFYSDVPQTAHTISRSIGISIIDDFTNDGLVDYLQIPHVPFSISNIDFETPINRFINPVANYGETGSSEYPESYSSSNFYYNNGRNGFSPSVQLMLKEGRAIPFDINNDGIDEMLITDYQNWADPNSWVSRRGENVKYWGYEPLFLSHFSLGSFNINRFRIFDNSIKDFKTVIAGDLDNNGFDDLLVSYLLCNTACDEEVTRVYWNNSSFDIDDFSDLDVFFSERSITFNSQSFLSDVVFDYDAVRIMDFINDGKNEILDFYLNETGETLLRIGTITENKYSILDEVNLGSILKFPKFADINSDNKVDLVFFDSNKKLKALLGANSIEMINDVITTNIYGEFLSLYDYDDKAKIYISHSNEVKVLEFTNNQFLYLENYIVRLGEQEKDFQSFEVKDLNNDEIPEFLYSKQRESLSLFSRKDYNSYERVTFPEGYIFFFPYYSLIRSSGIVATDVDGDEKLEIFTNGLVNYIRPYVFSTGLNYDPQHSGHGFSIENVAEELFYTVFYTYGNDSYPEWFADLGLFERPRQDYWNTSSTSNQLINYHYDYETNSSYQNTDDDYLGQITHDKCSDEYGSINLEYEIGLNPWGAPVSQGEWCSKPVVDYYKQPKNDLSGLWWAGGNDSGWGWSVSLVERENTTDMVVVLYYYDGEGNPRWLIGQQSGFIAGEEITLDMNMVKGYPRVSTPVDLELIHAGTMSLSLNQANNVLNQAGRMSIDVTYPGPEGGSWVRDDVPLALFSTPRN